MDKKARNYTSKILDELLSEITPSGQSITEKRMLLAARIDDALKAKGWRKGDLARKMNKQPSMITRWLSGTHNFESDTLFELEEMLGINLINLQNRQSEQILHFHLNLTQKVKADDCMHVVNEPGPKYHKVVRTAIYLGSC